MSEIKKIQKEIHECAKGKWGAAFILRNNFKNLKEKNSFKNFEEIYNTYSVVYELEGLRMARGYFQLLKLGEKVFNKEAYEEFLEAGKEVTKEDMYKLMETLEQNKDCEKSVEYINLQIQEAKYITRLGRLALEQLKYLKEGEIVDYITDLDIAKNNVELYKVALKTRKIERDLVKDLKWYHNSVEFICNNEGLSFDGGED